jgi:hypothetical protein
MYLESFNTSRVLAEKRRAYGGGTGQDNSITICHRFASHEDECLEWIQHRREVARYVAVPLIRSCMTRTCSISILSDYCCGEVDVDS